MLHFNFFEPKKKKKSKNSFIVFKIILLRLLRHLRLIRNNVHIVRSRLPKFFCIVTALPLSLSMHCSSLWLTFYIFFSSLSFFILFKFGRKKRWILLWRNLRVCALWKESSSPLFFASLLLLLLYIAHTIRRDSGHKMLCH